MVKATLNRLLKRKNKHSDIEVLIKKKIIDNELFDSEYYLNTYKGVNKSGIDPLEHFVLYGGLEGRNPSKSFQSEYYKYLNPKCKVTDIPLVHYINSKIRNNITKHKK